MRVLSNKISERKPTELNRLRSILFDWFDNRTHSKIDAVRFCWIGELKRTIGIRLGSIEV